MWITKHGVPFDVAFSIDDVLLNGLSIIASEQDSGKQFDWKSKQFVERS